MWKLLLLKKTLKKCKIYRYAQATKSFSPLWFMMRIVSLLLMLVMLWSTVNEIKTLLYICTLPRHVIQLQKRKWQMLSGSPGIPISLYSSCGLGSFIKSFNTSHSQPRSPFLPQWGQPPIGSQVFRLLTRTNWALLAQKAPVSIISSVQLGCIEHGSKEER